jgi:glycosyltransferase involved in cell wall biosynthesis
MPIVADPIACEGINVEDQKNVLFASSTEQYITNINKILADQKIATHLSRQARKLAEQEYSYNSIGKSLRDTYITAIQRKNN